MLPVKIANQYQQKKQEFQSQATIYYRSSWSDTLRSLLSTHTIGIALMLMAIGGGVAAFSPIIRVEANYQFLQVKAALQQKVQLGILALSATNTLPETPAATAPEKVYFNPLIATDGTQIIPINTDFSIVVPKVGINAPIIAGVNPAKANLYTEALKKGVAHASTSFYPNEPGTVYLFSHSTNYEWFVKDLNAVFYLLKNLAAGDYIVIMYLGNRYTYQVSDKKVVSPREVSYLVPSKQRNLILQTCWPPGTVSKRLLVFADLVDEARPVTE